MNLDEIFGLTQEIPLVATNPLLLLSSVLVAALAGWMCAWRYRDTFDIEKSIRLYIPLALIGAVVFTLLGVPGLFAGGAQLCGFVALLLISNHYFKK